jgi:phage-related protein
MIWTVEYLNRAVLKEAQALAPDQRARLQRIIELVQVHGLERVREPHVKHLEGRLWEMRISGQRGIARAVYVTAIGTRMVIVRVFVKKTQKTPRREIELALKRAEEVP